MIIDKIKQLAAENGYEPTEYAEKIAKAKEQFFGEEEWQRCPCDPNSDRACISDRCKEEIARDGHCHCNCYKIKGELQPYFPRGKKGRWKMKTLVQINIEPKIGMIVEALKGRYKHHIIEFGSRFLMYDKNGKSIYAKFVHTVNEKGSTSWIEYNNFINNYGYIGISDVSYKDLFNKSRLSIKKIDEIENLVKKLEEAIR